MIAEFLTELDYGDDDGRPETEVVRRLGACEAQKMGLAPTPSDEELVELGKKAAREAESFFLSAGALQRRVESLRRMRAFGEEIAAKYPAERRRNHKQWNREIFPRAVARKSRATERTEAFNGSKRRLYPGPRTQQMDINRVERSLTFT